MKRALSLLALSALVASVAASSAQAAPLQGERAKLVSVHRIKAAPPLPGKPIRRANCANDASTTATEYLLIGRRVSGPRNAVLSTGTIPPNLDQATTISALQAGFDVWKQAEGEVPTITVVTGGTATKHSANQENEVMWGRTGGSLATAYTWSWGGTTYETDVVFDKSYSWANLAPAPGTTDDGCFEEAGNVYDVGNLAAHEFGHVYGLNHPNPGRYETMYAYGYSGETLKRSPGLGDAAGIAALY